MTNGQCNANQALTDSVWTRVFFKMIEGAPRGSLGQPQGTRNGWNRGNVRISGCIAGSIARIIEPKRASFELADLLLEQRSLCNSAKV